MEKPNVYVEDKRGKHRRGVPNPAAGRKKGSVTKVPQAIVDKAVELLNGGVPKFQIARRLNLGNYVLNRILREYQNAHSPSASAESMPPSVSLEET